MCPCSLSCTGHNAHRYGKSPPTNALHNASWLSDAPFLKNGMRVVLFRVFPRALDGADLPCDGNARDAGLHNDIIIARSRYEIGTINKMNVKAVRGFNEWSWHRALTKSAKHHVVGPQPSGSAGWQKFPWIKGRVHVTCVVCNTPVNGGRGVLLKS